MDRNFTQFYECVTCTKWFNSKLSLIRHKSKHSDLNSQLVRNLRRKYLTYFKYRLRWKSIHAHNFYRNRYTCLECQKSFITTSAVESHMKMCHFDDEYKCLFCSEKYGNYSELMTHTLKHAAERPYCCYVCGKTFVSLTDLTKHEKSHSDKSYKCCVCDKKFSKVTDLERHSRIHSGLFLCKICGKGFYSQYSLSRHLGKTGRPLRPCKKCGFKFTASCEREPHLSSHLEKAAASYSQVTDLPSCCDQTVKNNCSTKEDDNLGVPFRESICNEQSHLSASEMFENLCDINTDVCLSEGGHIDTESLGADACDEANKLLPDTLIEKYAIKSLDGKISSLSNDIGNTNSSSHTSGRNGVTIMHTNSESHTIEVQEKMMINILDANKSLPEKSFEEIKLGVKRRLLAEEQCSTEIQMKTVTTVRPLARKSDAVNKRSWGQKRNACQYCGERIQTKKSTHYARCHVKKAVGSDQLMKFSVRKLPSDTLGSSVAYHCHICNKSFRSNAGLGSHRKIHVSSITSINEPSGSTAVDTTSSVSLSEQQTKSYNKKSLCSICNMRFESEAAFSSHKKLHMNIEINSSDGDGVIRHCDTFRKSRFGSNRVYRTVADVQTKIRKLPSKDEKIKHLKMKTRIICTVCKEIFCYKETFEVHAITHEKAGWNICNDCGKCFIKRTTLRSHQRRKHCKKEKKLSKILAGDLCEKDQNSKGASNTSLDTQDDGIEFRKSLHCSICKISFSQESYKAHVCVNEETVWFICWVCGKSYCTTRNLKKHQEQKHPNSKLVFSDKKSKLENINVIKKRNVKVRALKLKGKYECLLCKKRFDSQKSFRNHVVLHRKKTKSMYHKHGMTKLSRGQNTKVCFKEKRKRIICSICERIFYVKESFENHIKSHKEAAMHFCLACGKSYGAKSCLARHTKQKHSQSSTRVVSERFSGLKNIQIASQKKNGSLSCLECGKSYATKACLDRHHKQKHKQSSNSIVNEGFYGMKNTSIDHRAAHKGMGLLTCLDCGKSYTTKGNLNKHYRKTHQRSSAEVLSKDIETKNIIGEKIEVIDIKPALQKGNLNEKEVKKCPVCRRKYDCKETFKNHVLIHEKSDWYICYHCSLCFWKKSILVEHLRTFHSENCMLPETKTAIQNSENMLMNRDSLKAKEYKCSVCSSSYTFKVIFKNHVLLHEKEGWYVCCECGNSYMSKSNLDQHWVNNHLDIVRSVFDLEVFWKKTYGIVSELNVKINLMNPCSRCGEFYGDSRQDYQRHILTCCKGEIVKVETKFQLGYNDCNSKSNCKSLIRKRGNKMGINCSVCKQSFSSKGLLRMHLKIGSTCRLDPDDEVEKAKSGDRRNLVNTRIFPERGSNAISECNEENSGIDDPTISSFQTDVGNACVSNRNSPYIFESEAGKSKKRTHECQHCGTVFSSLERLNYHTRIFLNQREIFYSTRNHEKMLLCRSANDKEKTKGILTECEGSCVNNNSDQEVMKENLPEPEIPSVMNIPDQEGIVANLCMSVLPSVINHNGKERTEEILKECRTTSVWDPPILTSAMEFVEDLIPRTQKASAMSIHKALVFKENLSAFDDQKLGEAEDLCDKINAYPFTGEISVPFEPPVTHVKTQEREFAYGDNIRNVSKTESNELNSENCYRKNAEVKTMATENSAMSSMLTCKELTVEQNSCSKSKKFQQAKEHSDVRIPAEIDTSISGSNFGSCTATRINECNSVFINENIFFKAPTTVDLQSHQEATLHFDEISHASTVTDLSLEKLIPLTPQFKEISTALTVVNLYPGDFAGTDVFLKKSDKEIPPTEMSSPKTLVVLPGLKERSKESSSADLLPDTLELYKPSEETNSTAADAGSRQNFRKNKIPCTVNRMIFSHAARNTKNSRGPLKGKKDKHLVLKKVPVFRVRSVSVGQLSSNKQALPKKVLSSRTPGLIPKTCLSSEVSKAAAKSPYMTKVDQSSINRNPVSEVRSEVSSKKRFIPVILKKKNSSNTLIDSGLVGSNTLIDSGLVGSYTLIDSGLVGIHHIAEERLKLNLTSKKSAIITPLHCESRPASPFFKETVQSAAFSESQVEETASLNVVNSLSEHNAISSSNGDLTTTSVNTREEPEGRWLPISDDLPKIIPPRKTAVPKKTCYMTKEGSKIYLIDKSGSGSGSSSQGIVQESLKLDKEESVFCLPGLVQDESVNAKPLLVIDTPSNPGPFKIKIFTNSQHK